MSNHNNTKQIHRHQETCLYIFVCRRHFRLQLLIVTLVWHFVTNFWYYFLNLLWLLSKLKVLSFFSLRLGQIIRGNWFPKRSMFFNLEKVDNDTSKSKKGKKTPLGVLLKPSRMPGGATDRRDPSLSCTQQRP